MFNEIINKSLPPLTMAERDAIMDKHQEKYGTEGVKDINGFIGAIAKTSSSMNEYVERRDRLLRGYR